MSWRVEVFDRAVERELDGLPTGVRAKLDHVIQLIEEFGPKVVGAPHVRSLGHRLWEIRADSHEGHGRILYVPAAERRLVIVHAFVKKTRRTPKSSMDLARTRSREV